MPTERYQDYLLNVASVPVGGSIQVPLQLDWDAPFQLRLVRSRNIGLNGWRFQNPSLQYQSSGLRTDLILPAAPVQLLPPFFPPQGPFPSRGSVVYPEMIFPASSQIIADIGNTSRSPIVNAQLLFRGSKLFRTGAVTSYDYPAVMSPYPAIYPVVVTGVQPTGPARLFGQACSLRQNIPLTIGNDADFVFQYGVADPFQVGVDGGPVGSAFRPTRPAGVGSITNVYVQLKDESGKPYSNVPIHINDLFGQGLPNPNGSGANDDSVLFTPGLVTPEIYIPRRHVLYFDLYRFDDVSQGPVDLHFRFCGMKVFAQ